MSIEKAKNRDKKRARRAVTRACQVPAKTASAIKKKNGKLANISRRALQELEQLEDALAFSREIEDEDHS